MPPKSTNQARFFQTINQPGKANHVFMSPSQWQGLKNSFKDYGMKEDPTKQYQLGMWLKVTETIRPGTQTGLDSHFDNFIQRGTRVRIFAITVKETSTKTIHQEIGLKQKVTVKDKKTEPTFMLVHWRKKPFKVSKAFIDSHFEIDTIKTIKDNYEPGTDQSGTSGMDGE